MRIQKSAFKNQKPRCPALIARGDSRKTIKVMKVLPVKYAPVTCIVK